MPYLFAAYKKGALASMGGAFADTSMEAPGFKAAFTDEVMEHYHAAWTLFAPVPERGTIPVGVVLGVWPQVDRSPVMLAAGAVWFPWASPRNQVEAIVKFLGDIRHTIPMVLFCRPEHKRFYEAVCRHGVLNRIGTSALMFADAPATVFETRRSTS